MFSAFALGANGCTGSDLSRRLEAIAFHPELRLQFGRSAQKRVLLRCRQDAFPQRAIQINHAPLSRRQCNGDVREEIVPMADDHVGSAGHACMDGMFCKQMAEDCIGGVGWDAADVITGIEIFHADIDA